jgi:hypothetical protein
MAEWGASCGRGFVSNSRFGPNQLVIPRTNRAVTRKWRALDDYKWRKLFRVSCSGTKHIVGPQSSKLQAGRISALCGFSSCPEDEPLEALRDCEFCQREAFVAARRKAAEEEERERIRSGVAGAIIQPEKATVPADQILN